MRPPREVLRLFVRAAFRAVGSQGGAAVGIGIGAVIVDLATFTQPRPISNAANHYQRSISGMQSLETELETGQVGDLSPLGSLGLSPTSCTPFISDGFPPALIPLWSDELGYCGFWYHWFSSRNASIVLTFRHYDPVNII